MVQVIVRSAHSARARSTLKPTSSPDAVAIVEGREIRRRQKADGRHGGKVGHDVARARIGVIGQRLRGGRDHAEERQEQGEDGAHRMGPQQGWPLMPQFRARWREPRPCRPTDLANPLQQDYPLRVLLTYLPKDLAPGGVAAHVEGRRFNIIAARDTCEITAPSDDAARQHLARAHRARGRPARLLRAPLRPRRGPWSGAAPRTGRALGSPLHHAERLPLPEDRSPASIWAACGPCGRACSGSELTFVAPGFEQVLALAATQRQRPSFAARIRFAPPEAIESAVARAASEQLMDEARHGLTRRWPRASAATCLPASARVGFALVLLRHHRPRAVGGPDRCDRCWCRWWRCSCWPRACCASLAALPALARAARAPPARRR